MQRASGENYTRVKRIVERNSLHTICTSGNCPNIGECWNAGTATFMILGNICTRACKFCNTATGRPLPPDENEPERLALSVKELGLKHCVITSVDRDDLKDSGAEFWARVIRKVREVNKGITIEALIPDFDGKEENLRKIFEAAPEVISHNVETVRRLTPAIRTKARYDRSLEVVRMISGSGLVSKSGLMVGLGETIEEVHETIRDLAETGCMVLTIGQYLQPSKSHIGVKEYYTPGMFAELEEAARNAGFLFVESSPLVRSSFHAEKHVKAR